MRGGMGRAARALAAARSAGVGRRRLRASARRRRWSPTTAYRWQRSPRRCRSTRRCWPTPDPDAGHAVAAGGVRARAPTCPQALAAIDLALWDRAGRRAGRPVAELLARRRGGCRRRQRDDRRRGPRRRRSPGRRGGARRLRLREGEGRGRRRCRPDRGGPRRGGPGGRDPRRRQRRLVLGRRGARAPARARPGRAGVRRGAGRTASTRCASVRAVSPVPLAMDETAAQPGAVASGATDAVCLKIARCGGITGLLRDAVAARAAGSAVYVASTFDGPLGVAAAVHAAAALAASGPVAHCGLATLGAVRRARRRARAACRPHRRAAGPGCWRRKRRERRHGAAGGVRLAERRQPRIGATQRRSPRSPRRPRQHVRHGPGRLELHRVAGAGHDVEPRVRQRGLHPLGDRAELRVALPHDELDRQRRAPPAGPRAAASRRCPSPRSAAASPAAVLRSRSASATLRDPARHAGEQRLGAPLAHELRRARSPRSGPRAPRRRRREPRARPRRPAPGSPRPGRAARRGRRARARRAARCGRPSSTRRA